MPKRNPTDGPPVLRLQPLVLQVYQEVPVARVVVYLAPMMLQQLWRVTHHHQQKKVLHTWVAAAKTTEQGDRPCNEIFGGWD